MENQIYSTCNTDEKQIVELMRKITISSINIQKNTQKEEKKMADMTKGKHANIELITGDPKKLSIN